MSDNFTLTKICLHWKLAQLLNLWPSTLQAAEAMHRLNRHAHQRDGQHIYPAKSQLVKLFYERGFCERLTLQEQILRCTSNWHWYSQINDLDDDDQCPKCGGTGIYKTYLLFLFRFSIQGKIFEWHQPVGLVPWLPTSKAEIGGQYENTSPAEVVEGTRVQAQLFARVYMYLLRHGIRAEFNHPSLLNSIRRDFRNTELHRRLDHIRIHLRSAITGKDPQSFDDCIPF